MSETIGTAYIKIAPETSTLKKELSGDVSGAGVSAGNSIGSSLVSTLKGVIAAAGIGAALKSSLDAGGAIQQSFGGLDTLYGEASDAAKEYAKQAYSAGISANDYAEQAVSFGAALKSAFGGDVTKAAESANTAIMDMTDNAAKMGTDIESIQNAYQGFAKSNYSMLDNLKLGYGGTKSEMERLLKDAEKLTGVTYDIDNLGDVYSAIHAIQGDLGLTGVAAEEASGTFTGSFGAMQAAAQNLLAALSADEMDVTPQMEALVQTATTFLVNNLIPMVVNIMQSLPEAIGAGIQTAAPLIKENLDALLPQVLSFGTDVMQTLHDGILSAIGILNTSGNDSLQQFLAGVTAALPGLLSEGVEMVGSLVNGILSNLPALITTAGTLINTFLSFFLSNLPTILEAGVQLLATVAQGIVSNLPEIVTAVISVIGQFAQTVLDNLPTILESGVNILMELITGILNTISDLVAALPDVIDAIVDTFGDFDWLSIGSNIVAGIAEGITNGAKSIIEAAQGLAQSAYDAACDALGIESPSKVFKTVGMYTAQGFAIGIEDNTSYAEQAARDMSNSSYEVSMSVADGLNDNTTGGAAAGYTQYITVNSPTELTPSEVARQTRNATRDMVLAMGGA